MQYDVSSPKEHIESLEANWRNDALLDLRDLNLQQDSSVNESINYKMLCFKVNDSDLFHLNAQKGYVSLYCGNTEKIDPEGRFLTGLNIGKGCIRFRKTKTVSKTKI